MLSISRAYTASAIPAASLGMACVVAGCRLRSMRVPWLPQRLLCSSSNTASRLVGVGSVYLEGNPCNMHLRDMAGEMTHALAGSESIRAVSFETVGVSDAISMGTDGMSYSLPSRDLIADTMETVGRAAGLDALATIAGCDKNMPGAVMAMVRLDIPSLMVYGGSIMPGFCKRLGRDIDVVTAAESYGQLSTGLITESERNDIVRHACPGPGGCGGMFTANTMSTAIEALGLSLPYSSSSPAVSTDKRAELIRAADALQGLLESNIRPSHILTRQSFENAIAVVMALGGSTNAVLHLIAIARTAGGETDARRLPGRIGPYALHRESPPRVAST